MNFLGDESLDGPIVDALRVEGHAVIYVPDIKSGIDDDQVMALANSSQSILMTEDKDFGELVYRMKRVTGGVVLIRLAGVSKQGKIDQVVSGVRKRGDEMAGAFTVISPEGCAFGESDTRALRPALN